MTDNYNEEMDFEALLQEYMPEESENQTGEKVKGHFLQKDRNYAYLDVPGARTAVRVNLSEVEDFDIGSEIEIVLKGETKEQDFIIGSRLEIERIAGLEILEKAFEGKEPTKGTITKKINGGYLVNVSKHQAFLPNSLSEIPLKDTANHIGEEVDLIIRDIQDGRHGKKILVSRKDIRVMAEREAFANVSIGDEVEVAIRSILDFGLAVKFGYINGFIHISELSWGKVDNITELYSVGDTLKAKVIATDEEKSSLKLSVKQLTEDPWNTIEEKYSVDSVVEGTVTKLVSFGAFIKLEDWLEGLVHISDFSWNKSKVNVSNYLKVGDKVKVKIIKIDKEAKKMKFGLKQLAENPWDTIDDKIKEGEVAKGKVVEVKDFGIFVEVEEGMDVFIHQSDFSWKREKKTFTIGDEVEFKVMNISKEEQRLKGSIKDLTKSPWEEAKEQFSVGDVVTKEITSIADFGLFVKLTEDVDGMIHTSQVSTEFVKNLSESFSTGQEVTAEIIEIDDEKKRIKLSIKKYQKTVEAKEHRELLEKYGTVGEEEN